MKANLVVLMLLTMSPILKANEVLLAPDGGAKVIAYAYDKPDFSSTTQLAENEKDLKIVMLSKLLDQQQKLYEDKVNYLEMELKKSKERLVEKSINTDKMQAALNRSFSEESNYFKKELVAKTRSLMEYQRQLEKIKPSEDMKNLIKINTELALENRRTSDKLALIELKGVDGLAKALDSKVISGGRMPASAEK
jgi:hypothetical protein